MSLKKALLAEFEHEMTGTRKVLERVPEAQFGWTPHAKSMPAGRLAGHLAGLPGWVPPTLQLTELDITNYKSDEPATTAELLAIFDRNVEAGRAALSACPDDAWGVDWSLTGHGHTYFTMPRAAVIRSFVFNHIVHHRAQLTVYLRLLGAPVPGLYGPSADES